MSPHGTPSPEITITIVMTNGRSHLTTHAPGYPTGERAALNTARILAHADEVERVIVAHGPNPYTGRPAAQLHEIHAVNSDPNLGYADRPAPIPVERAKREHIHDSYAEAARAAITQGDQNRADRMIRARDNAATYYAEGLKPEEAVIQEMQDERDHVATLYADKFGTH